MYIYIERADCGESGKARPEDLSQEKKTPDVRRDSGCCEPGTRRGRRTGGSYLRIVSEKKIYFSAEAGETLGERVEVYEKGSVLAVVREQLGTYHLSVRAGSGGRYLCSAELGAYLMKKFHCGKGICFTVWHGEHENVALFGIPPDEGKVEFDESFKRLELTYRKRYGDWVFVEDNCVSFTAGVRGSLPPRLDLYECGGALALRGSEEGRYSMEERVGRKGAAVYSGKLADYCRSFFQETGRSVLLHARRLPDGVCFARREEELKDTGEFKPMDLGTSLKQYLSLGKRGSIYLSAQAAKKVGEACTVYRAGDTLALRPEPEGSLRLYRFGYQNLLNSTSFRRVVERYYPETARIYLVENDGLLILSRMPEGEDLPRLKGFQRMELGTARRTGKSALGYEEGIHANLHL